MDNALIDDRRVHVDFSQSVAKLWSQYRRNAQTGKGCFKCGSSDHMAKDCIEDAKNNQTTKYILKDNNAQRGGDDARYEMVFDGDGEDSPRQGKGHRKHDKVDPIERKSMHRGHRDQDNRDRYADRKRGGRYERSARDVDSRSDRNNRDKHMDRRRDDGYGRKDDRDSRKRYNNDSHSKRGTGADYRRKTNSSHVERRDDRDKEYSRDREKRKRDSSAEDGHEDRRRMDDRDPRTKHEDPGRQDSKNESRERKRNADDDEDYRRRREEKERGQRRKVVEFDDDRHRSDRR